MKRYYISHPFTGNEEKNKADADRIRAALKEANPSICFMNPLGMFGNKDTDYCTALADAMELLSLCDTVIFCPGWEESTGCRAEKAFSIQQGIKIMYLEDFKTEYNAARQIAKGMVDAMTKEAEATFAFVESIRKERGND